MSRLSFLLEYYPEMFTQLPNGDVEIDTKQTELPSFALIELYYRLKEVFPGLQHRGSKSSKINGRYLLTGADATKYLIGRLSLQESD